MLPDSFAKLLEVWPDLIIEVNGDDNVLRCDVEQIQFLRHSPASKNTITVNGSHNEIVIEDGGTLRDSHLIVEGSHGKITLGAKTRLRMSAIKLRGNHCLVEIGKDTTIESAKMLCQEDGRLIRIGDDCMFSEGIFIRTSDSHAIVTVDTGERINPARDVVIGRHVWMGRDVKINKGVSIGDGCVIAHGSVVVKDVPANCVIGGNPGRVIKEGVTWSRALNPQPRAPLKSV